MLDIGSLNRQIEILAPSTERDELGQPVDAWTVFTTTWANIAHKSGLETIKADAETSILKASIRIRFRTDITSAMRVKDKKSGTVYEIKTVIPDFVEQDKTDLACEVVNGVQ